MTLKVSTSDIPLTENQTDTEMCNLSKTHTETNAEKIFNTDTTGWVEKTGPV